MSNVLLLLPEEGSRVVGEKVRHSHGSLCKGENVLRNLRAKFLV